LNFGDFLLLTHLPHLFIAKISQLGFLVFHDLLEGFNQFFMIAKVIGYAFVLWKSFLAGLVLKKAILLGLMKLQEILYKARVFILRNAQKPSSVIIDSRIGKKILRGCVKLESFSDFPLFVRVVSSP
jgi:hypothetical protein